MAANDQFNEQYEAAVETIKSRAIWRIGERRLSDESGAGVFRCSCPKCGYESRHERIQVSRHRLLFGKPIRQIEAGHALVRCSRCGQERHSRDMDRLVVPSTVALADSVTSLAARATGDTPDRELQAAIAAFREESSGPVRAEVFDTIVGQVGADRRALLESIGRELFLTSSRIATALGV